jgi:hypothetical protein
MVKVRAMPIVQNSLTICQRQHGACSNHTWTQYALDALVEWRQNAVVIWGVAIRRSYFYTRKLSSRAATLGNCMTIALQSMPKPGWSTQFRAAVSAIHCKI